MTQSPKPTEIIHVCSNSLLYNTQFAQYTPIIHGYINVNKRCGISTKKVLLTLDTFCRRRNVFVRFGQCYQVQGFLFRKIQVIDLLGELT